MAALLNNKLCKIQPKSFWFLTVSEKKAVDRLKDIYRNQDIFVLPQATGHYTVDNYGCHKIIGCVLLQEHTDRPASRIGYCSRKLNDKKRELAAAHGKFLAVVWAVVLLRHYVEGIWFTV